MKKILVTGGAGAIGFQLAKALINKGEEVYIADNFIRGERDQAFIDLITKSNVHEINIDLSNYAFYEKLPDDIDYIYHFCAYNGTQNFYERSFEVLIHSTLPTINLLKKYASSKKLKRFIYAGSSEAYACSITRFDWEIPTDETVPLGIDNPFNPRWSYGGSKMHGELACIAAAKEFSTPFTILRYHNIYGPRMGDKHVIPDFIARAKLGNYELYGYEETRSFLFVADAVAVTMACAENPDAINEIIHLGSEEEIKILDLANLMMRLMSKTGEIKLHPSPQGSVKCRVPNISKLKRLINFQPQYSLEEGLLRTIKFYAPELID